MVTEIITIGDEILIGQIVDTNSQWLSIELNKIGVSVNKITSIQDDYKSILNTISKAQKESDLVFVTGGLGPTSDDITKEVLVDYFDDYLVLNSGTLEHIEKKFKNLNNPLRKSNYLQAMIPSKCEVLNNELGTAPGMWFLRQGKVLVSLPGVPSEMRALIKSEVIPRIKSLFNLPFIIHKNIVTYGISESALSDILEQWEINLPSFLKLAYLPNFKMLRLRLTAKGLVESDLKEALRINIEKLYSIISEYIVVEGEISSIEELIAYLLSKRGQTLATAESCTGGRIASNLTVNPGATSYFKGGVISYTESMKEQLLNVDSKIIKEHSVVSELVAIQMAKGVKELLGSDFAVSTTGNAGPTKDKTDMQVGVVYIAIATPNGVFSKKYKFGETREQVIEKTVNKSFELLVHEIKKN